MKSKFNILNNIKDILPYLLLITIYFFFVNLEARKDKKNTLNSDVESVFPDDKSSYDEKKLRITIPVIPYNQ